MFQSENNSFTTSKAIGSDRKRLGQFFTGPLLSRLLAYIANAERANSAIDPMCGTGDMLSAVHEVHPTTSLSGIEIDSQLIGKVRSRFGQRPITLVHGSAFESRSLRQLNSRKFDLVITNPPYVRYQSISNTGRDGIVPAASRVRSDLLDAADYLITDSEEHSLYHKIIRSYSGLSDLALPSWILASMLVKEGGILALVIPESWLSRDYAQVVQYILLRCFRIRCIVEDTNASWFPDALVKTTLLVAERVSLRNSAFAWGREIYVHVRISDKARTATSLVGNLFPGDIAPEKEFTKELETVLREGKENKNSLWSAEPISLSETADNLRRVIQSESWCRKCEPHEVETGSSAIVPIELRRLLTHVDKEQFTSLSAVSIEVGQGLRTGANPFFYVDIIEQNKKYSIVAPNKVFHIGSMRVPPECIRPVLRKQSELPDSYRIEEKLLKGRVLMLSEDKISGDLRDFVNIASTTRLREKLIPDLSAVRTNIRRATPDRNGLSNWYSLPPFAPRHIPILFIPRVNSLHPKTFVNIPGVIIDANFSTIWIKPDSHYTKWSLFAFLNSAWSIAAMELIGSVMGGGALKLEATHLKKLPVPRLTAAQIEKLDTLGKDLAESGDQNILTQISEVVVSGIFGDAMVKNKLAQLGRIAERRLKERSSRS